MRLLPEGRSKKRFAIAAYLFAACLFIVWLALPPVWQLKRGPIEVERWLANKTDDVVAVVGPKQAEWTNYSRISRHLIYAVIVAEDARFFEHSGLDMVEISRSFKKNIRLGRYARGASTITQQVVKVAFLSAHKNILRKGREALGALALEQILPKKEILQWYLNMVEFGDGIYGVTRAAQHYFGTKPELLTIPQATHLALVLPSPNKWSQGLRQRNLTDFGHDRFHDIITKMRRVGYITETQWDHAMATGNFGRPINFYPNGKLTATVDSSENPETDDPEMDDIPTIDTTDNNEDQSGRSEPASEEGSEPEAGAEAKAVPSASEVDNEKVSSPEPGEPN